MMEFNIINQIFIFLIALGGFCLAIWVYLAKKESRINQTFSLYTIFYISWIVLGYLLNFFSSDYDLSLYLAKLRFGSVAVCAVFTYLFSLFFPRKEKMYPFLTKVVFLWGIVSFSILIFSNLIIEGVQATEWGANIVFGKGSLFFFGGIIILSFLIPYILFEKYHTFSKEEKSQVQYFLIGVLIFVAANLIFNVLFPILGTYKYYQLGDYSAVFLLGFTAYAIIKRELFGIKVILTQTLVGSMGILLFLSVFFMPTPGSKGLVFVIFILFCLVGYLLIKATLKETRQKEVFAGMVQDRTKELEQSKKVAEERAAELERWYKLTIGREVRMAELKEKIKEMENKK
ncbi:MAG: histidine kinase N-terminal 7TM domain-containing protein [Candidatus Paceibacterota bacterium]